MACVVVERSFIAEKAEVSEVTGILLACRRLRSEGSTKPMSRTLEDRPRPRFSASIARRVMQVLASSSTEALKKLVSRALS
jgi:hypothetical protein